MAKQNPYSEITNNTLKEVKERLASLQELFKVLDSESKIAVLNNLWTYANHWYVMRKIAKPRCTKMDKHRYVCTSFYYCYLLVNLTDKQSDELIVLTSKVIGVLNTHNVSSMLKLLNDGLNKYIDQT